MAIVVFEHSEHFGAGIVARVMRRFGHVLRVVRPFAGEAIPPDLDDVHGVISCGGPQAAYGTEPWLSAEMNFLRAAHEERVPVLGLCLGAQLLAKALGGEVQRSPEPEIGWHEVALSPVGREEPLLAGVPWRSMQLHWHHDQITRLPAGARVLASSARTKVQAFGAGVFSVGFQYHFEWDRELIGREMAISSAELSQAGVDPQSLREATSRHIEASERLAERVAERIAICLMGVDRQNRGSLRQLQH